MLQRKAIGESFKHLSGEEKVRKGMARLEHVENDLVEEGSYIGSRCAINAFQSIGSNFTKEK